MSRSYTVFISLPELLNFAAAGSDFWLTIPSFIWSVILTLFGSPYFSREFHTLAVGIIALLFWIAVAKFLVALLNKVFRLDNRRGGQ